MSMLFFMPWCPIDKAYDLDWIRILPYRRGDLLEGLDQIEQSHLDAIMGMYKTIDGKPILELQNESPQAASDAADKEWPSKS